MALTTRLDVRQTQAPVMTPQLQQAIKLLQLSNLELAAFVETELEENPLLEREDTLIEDESAPAETRTNTGDDGDAATLTGREVLGSEKAPLDTNYTNVWQDDPFRPAGGGVPAPVTTSTTRAAMAARRRNPLSATAPGAPSAIACGGTREV